MRGLKTYRFIGIIVLVLLIGVLLLVGFVTSIHQNLTPKSAVAAWTVQNHLLIMTSLVIVSVLFGFALAMLTSRELKKTKDVSANLLSVLFLFLNPDEKSILNHLVEKKGKTTQAHISRLEDMNRVKAFRSLQKMQERGLVEIVPDGKVRNIKLKENIHELLS